MTDLLAALGLALVIEGAAYALLAPRLREALMRLAAAPESWLRLGGLAAAIVGLLLVWIARG